LHSEVIIKYTYQLGYSVGRAGSAEQFHHSLFIYATKVFASCIPGFNTGILTDLAIRLHGLHAIATASRSV
jgi:hypothetical protein